MNRSGSAHVGTLGALVLTLLLAASAGGAFAARASTSSPVTSAKFTDATGDSGSALDIQSVVVSSDASHVTVNVNTPGTQTAPADAIVGIEFDTDQNWATGNVDLDGAEYEFRFQGSDNRFALYH